MSQTLPIHDVIQRVEALLDALNVRGPDAAKLTAAEFQIKSEAMYAFIDTHKTDIAAVFASGTDADIRHRAEEILVQLEKLEMRASQMAQIPAGLQKYIADHND